MTFEADLDASPRHVAERDWRRLLARLSPRNPSIGCRLRLANAREGCVISAPLATRRNAPWVRRASTPYHYQAALKDCNRYYSVSMNSEPLTEDDAIAHDQLALEEQELVPLVPDQGEDESDFQGESAAFVASITSKDWTVETLVSQLRKDRIDLSPRFQRRNAWLDNRKSKLVESIILGFPIPQIVLAEKKGAPGTYFVLDGKQRLLSLRQFFVDRADPRDHGFDSLRLTNLEVLTDLNSSDRAKLEVAWPDMAARLENATIRTVVLSDWNSERMLLSLFLRLNTGSVPLSPQELRQALIPGAFVEWLDDISGKLKSLQALLGNSHPDRRMVDAELMLRHMAFASSPLKYRGNLKQFLDGTSAHFNDQWNELSSSAHRTIDEFDRALTVCRTVFGDRMCRKWSGTRFERALNRAVFDIQLYAASMPKVRAAMTQHGDSILAEYQRACVENVAFLRAISTTTKTVEAFITRHRTWQDILDSTCGVQYPLPEPLVRE